MILPIIKNLFSQDIAHVFSANFADDCVISPCNTYSIPTKSFLVLDKIMHENPHTLLVKTGSDFLAANTSSDSIPTWLLIVICVVVFFIAGFIGGYISYNTKLKKLRENKEDPPPDNDSKE